MQERQPSYRECAKLPILQRSIESTRPLENGYVLLPSGRFLAHPVSEISFSRKQVSVNRSQSQGKITMCEVSTSSLLNNSWLSARQVCHVRPRVQNGGKTYPTCRLTCAAALKSSSSPSSNENAAALEPLIASFQQLSLSESSDSYHSPHQPSRASRT
jgi:hypothetical protein